jgi:hypothetical protein
VPDFIEVGPAKFQRVYSYTTKQRPPLCFDFRARLKAAKTLGLKVPQTLQVAADAIVE